MIRAGVALLAVMLAIVPAAARPGKTGTLYMGLGGWLFAGPLHVLRNELAARGARVAVLPWWLPIGGGGDFVAGHSQGAMAANAARAPCRLAIDPVAVDWPRIQVAVWTPPRAGYPPGRPLSRARNIRVDGATHVTLPAVARKRIADVLLGGCR